MTNEIKEVNNSVLRNVASWLNRDEDIVNQYNTYFTYRDLNPFRYYEMESYMQNNPKMKPAKAIAHELYKRYKIKLSPEQKSELGNMLSVVYKVFNVTIKQTSGCDGSAREYYHGGSCWWDEYEESRDWLESNGGGAFRAYDDSGHIVGRIWYMPYEGNFILFNSYGKGQLEHTDHWGAAIAKQFNWQYKPVQFVPSICTGDGFYLNSQNAVLVGESASECEKDRLYVEFDAPDHWVYSNGMQCACCGNRMHEDSSYYTDNGEYICEDCMSNEYVWLENDELTHIDNAVCLHDGAWVYDDDARYVDGENYRENEVIEDVHGDYHVIDSGTYTYCDHCDEIYPNDEIESIGDELICKDCAEDFPVCCVCNNHVIDNGTMLCGEVHCDDCKYEVSENQLEMFPCEN